MISQQHASHLKTNRSHSNCNECRADTERQFVSTAKWSYSHVADYLKCAKPRLEAIRKGEDAINARIWLRQFRKALDRRISLKVPPVKATRKANDGYLERLNMSLSGRGATERYLRAFADRGASCLH